MTSSQSTDGHSIPVSIIGQLIGIFALVGIGIGLTGTIALSEFGSDNSILSGILILIVLTVTFLLGPVVAVIGSLRTGQQLGQTSGAYLTSLVGSLAGYFVMVLLVFGILMTGMGIVADSQSTGSNPAASTPTASSQSGGGGGSTLPISEYLIPIIAVALPTGIAGVGSAYLGGSTASDQNSGGGATVSTRKLGAIVGVITIVIAGVGSAAVVTPGSGVHLDNGDPSAISVDNGQASFYSNNNQLMAGATFVYHGEKLVETTATARLEIDGEVVDEYSASQTITMDSGQTQQVTWTLAELDEEGYIEGLSDSQQQAINRGDYTFVVLVDGETVHHQPGQ